MVNATVLRNGFMKMGTDYAVPIARNREMLRYYRQRLEAELPSHYVIYGHIGDAHTHVNMLPSSEREELAIRGPVGPHLSRDRDDVAKFSHGQDSKASFRFLVGRPG